MARPGPGAWSPGRRIDGQGGRRYGLAVRVVGLLLLWAATVAAIVLDHLGDPYDETRVGTEVYGHNAPGTLGVVLGATFLELLIILIILRPGSYLRSWGRPLSGLVVLAPLIGLSLVMSMHAGGILLIHLLWLAVLATLCVLLVLISGTAAFMNRGR